MIRIPFNKPFLAGNELTYIQQAVQSGKISGNGPFTKKCHQYFQEKYNFNTVLLTTSCTDALEMAAILCKIKVGDEVIAPAYSFVSTVNAFVLRGAHIVFSDSQQHHPNIDADKIEELITERTKAIVVIHYAGVACDMDKILLLARKYNLFVIEDAAQSIDSYYKGRPLGSFGDFGTFSFHETKNIISGEGGLLVINNTAYLERAEVIWEKGTNRVKFSKGEINKYQWIDIGSSFLPSEITAAFLFAQLEMLDQIQARRREIWKRYFLELNELQVNGLLELPQIPEYATNNAHIFYILCKDQSARDSLLKFLNDRGVYAVFHYLSLSDSPYYEHKGNKTPMYNAVRFEKCLIRLPLFVELQQEQQTYIIEQIKLYFDA